MQRPAQGAQPAAIELGPVDRPEPSGSSGSSGGPTVPLAEPGNSAPYRPDGAWPGRPPSDAGDPAEDHLPPLSGDDTVTGPPRLLPPPPWLARELDRPEPVAPAVPFFDRGSGDAAADARGPDGSGDWPDGGESDHRDDPAYGASPSWTAPDWTPPTGPPDGPPTARRRPRRFALLLTGLLALFLVAAVAGANLMQTRGGGGGGPTADAQPAPAAPDSAAGGAPAPGAVDDGDPVETAPATERLVTGPRGDLQEAEFDLVSGTTTVNIRAVDLGDELYRVSTPIDADVQPRIIADDDSRIQLHLVPSGQTGPGVVDIQLNSAVRWQLRLTGGVAQHAIDLTAADLDGVDIVGGAARIDLALPAPDGTMTVRMTGGANQFVVSAPDGPPARVSFGAGAGDVTLDDRQRGGVAPGAVFTGRGFADATDRYDIDVVAGASVFTLQRD
ncbi:hypothetical protein O7608_23850 [Solwaraspora sp. WMMA2056]|uniref:hypothetical protein n=1 Tax=Solwaraspora sp. WMMA2056 TaxID=3015161 RepID=UPI00259B07DA|nr:hypothetical protein [Solwaraspora sp. WMMA2056]WJK39466.1 hypothetical protein O7608_23850 [Solwaraspora sp. WMMA2056]